MDALRARVVAFPVAAGEASGGWPNKTPPGVAPATMVDLACRNPLSLCSEENRPGWCPRTSPMTGACHRGQCHVAPGKVRYGHEERRRPSEGLPGLATESCIWCELAPAATAKCPNAGIKCCELLNGSSLRDLPTGHRITLWATGQTLRWLGLSGIRGQESLSAGSNPQRDSMAFGRSRSGGSYGWAEGTGPCGSSLKAHTGD